MPGELLLERPPAHQPWLPGQTPAGIFQREADGAGQLREQEVQQEDKGVCREAPEPVPGAAGLPAQEQLQCCAAAGPWQGGRAALQLSKPALQPRDRVQGSKGNPERPQALHW